MYSWGMFEMKRFVSYITMATVAIATLLGSVSVSATELEAPAVPEQVPVAIDPVDAFLAQSAFIGNSVGEGLTMYNNAKKKVPLGNATMLTRVSYSFLNDAGHANKFIPVYNGVPMQAKDAVKACGAQYVFICMGTNDLVGASSVDKAVARYREYIMGILAENPGILIFIESCTPTRPGSNVNNDKITQFNAAMQAYTASFPNMNYVDISTPLKDETGFLSAKLCSDGSVHLTNAAYAIWAQTIRNYITAFLSARLTGMAGENKALIARQRKANEKNMKLVADKKQEMYETRVAAEREAVAAEKAKKKEQLLTAPDTVLLSASLLRSADQQDLSLFVHQSERTSISLQQAQTVSFAVTPTMPF